MLICLACRDSSTTFPKESIAETLWSLVGVMDDVLLWYEVLFSVDETPKVYPTKGEEMEWADEFHSFSR